MEKYRDMERHIDDLRDTKWFLIGLIIFLIIGTILMVVIVRSPEMQKEMRSVYSDQR